MGTVEIIRQIDVEISLLQQARALLSESDSGEVKRKPGRPSGSRVVKSLPVALPPKAITQPRRKMSAAGRSGIDGLGIENVQKAQLGHSNIPGARGAARRQKMLILLIWGWLCGILNGGGSTYGHGRDY